MHAGVLGAADIFVDRQHLVDDLGIERLLVVVRVGIAQEIPRRADEGVQGIGVASCRRAALGTGAVHEFLALQKRGSAVGSEVHVVRQLDGEILFGNGDFAAVRAVYHGNGAAPISLAGDEPVAQAVVGLEFARAFFFQPFDDGDFALFAAHAVELAAVDHHAVFAERQIVRAAVRALYHALDLQAVFFGEVEVALVVRRNAHDRARAVRIDDIVAYPDGYAFAVDGIYAVSARESARLFARGAHSVYLGDLGAGELICLHLGFAIGRGELVHERMFGRENDVRNAEDRVGARGEHAELVAAFTGEFYLSARAVPDPMALHGFCLFRPVKLVKVAQKLVGIGGYLEKPLREVFSHHLRAAAFAMTVHDLLVGENGVAGSAPVDGRFFAIGKPRLVKLQKYPLRPFIIVGHAGLDFVVPIEHAAHGLKLFFHGGDVFERGILGMNARLDGVVFRGKAEGVKAHRLKDLVSLHALEAREAVGRSEVVPMPDVQFRARGI